MRLLTWTAVPFLFSFVICVACGGSVDVPPDVAAPPADAVKTPSGLASRVLKPGSGTRHPQPTDSVLPLS